MDEWLAAAALVLAGFPALLFLKNLRDYRPPPAPDRAVGPVSVLIPARDEERAIARAVQSALASRGVDVEVVVLDDGSADRTAEIVGGLSKADQRVRMICGPPLPAGWAGKQHACHVLASAANHELMLFIDADVTLAPDGAARMVAFLESGRADLVSGIPRQVTDSILEMLVIPLIHFLLLAYLPVGRMRRDRHPAFGAGCGQLFLTRRSAYEKAGGHAAIRLSFHDGVQLPRAYRRARLRTDLCDATDVAECRMYTSAGDLWRGLSKNAGEGIGSPCGIVPWTVLLAGGHVLPFVLLGCWAWLSPTARLMTAASCALSWLPRLIAVLLYRQSPVGAAGHALGVLSLLAIQWLALVRRYFGRPLVWKGRAQP